MKITTIQFIASSPSEASCPETDKPEFAFIGRSNVGKSSLINRIADHKGVAKTSSTPGKTRMINHFLVNDAWFIVDLPGYGFARLPKSERLRMQRMIHDYLLKREKLFCTFLLIDSRLEPQKNDLAFITWMGDHQIPFIILFTKTDKLPKQTGELVIEKYRNLLAESWDPLPTMIVTSSKTEQGKEEVLNFIDRCLDPG